MHEANAEEINEVGTNGLFRHSYRFFPTFLGMYVGIFWNIWGSCRQKAWELGLGIIGLF